MTICQPHWNKLSDAIKERGLWPLVAKNGKEAVLNVEAELAGVDGPQNYDPLMSCFFMITQEAINQGGLYLLSLKEDGTEYCPVCEAIAHRPKEGPLSTPEAFESHWINGPADAAKEFVDNDEQLTALLKSRLT